jgi:hypothetical protein
MLELFGWNVGMSLMAAMILTFGALVVGVALQFIGDVRVGYEFAFTSIASLIGGYLGSEAFGTLSTTGPAIGGLYVVPAIIGGLVVGFVVDAATRYVTDGSYVGAPRPI